MTSRVVAGYFPSWSIYKYDRAILDELPQILESSGLTHLIYAFYRLDVQSGRLCSTDPYADGGDGGSWQGNLAVLHILKSAYPSLQLGLALGGWSERESFRPALRSEETISTAVRSILEFFSQNPYFSFLDIDWEYPCSPGDRHALTSFLGKLHDAWISPSSPYVTMAIPADIGRRLTDESNNWPSLSTLTSTVRLFFLMTYDFAGSWSSKTAHHASLVDTNHAVQAALKAGIPAASLVLGLPLYARVFAQTDGPGRSFDNTGLSEEEQVVNRRDLPEPVLNQCQVDAAAGASYCHDSSTRKFYSLESPTGLKGKLDLASRLDLRGIFVWHLAGDVTVNHHASLISRLQ